MMSPSKKVCTRPSKSEPMSLAPVDVGYESKACLTPSKTVAIAATRTSSAKHRQAVILTVRRSVFDRHIPPVDKTGLAQTPTEIPKHGHV
jgi:hypothetical protein